MNKPNTPEQFMKPGFEHLNQARESFCKALPLYTARNDDNKADQYNIDDIKRAIMLLDKAYDEISAIWENDINT